MYTYKKIDLKDVDQLAVDYMNYFNRYEEASWTLENAKRRLRQLFNREDALGFLMMDKDLVIGFGVGVLTQFDDGLIFELSELLIYKAYQNKGNGSLLIQKLETHAKEQGAFRAQLFAFDDQEHTNFYQHKHQYSIAKNNLIWTKAL